MCADSDCFKRAVVFVIVVVFAACYVANNALISIIVVSHDFHLDFIFHV